ncbi:glycosyltransferase family 4 protein [Qipengyuania sphaerica]|uniref:glycosyltransferase family 4 protein n=1 Tax=Qipengyuania sphaerica TaxID=2867243 RepID=UPI001C881180|nr:glycosyltransferase family 4 protein [Qipengyuania sphaerica]MBX7539389.1 glycosyltransferase family 4 protein [Qipengyuania sphaerica]
MRKIGYLVSDLAAPSHTFVRREIEALGRQEIPVEAYSIHGDIGSETYQAILGRPIHQYVIAAIRQFFGEPIRTTRTLFLALRHRPPGIRHLIWSIFHFVEAIFLARLLREDGCAHLHNHFANSGATVGMLAAHQAGISWSLTLHGISETDFPAIATLRDKLEAAAFVACASRFMMAQGMRLVDPEYGAKFLVVRCGIDLGSLPRPRSATSGSPLRVLAVGRLSAEKGYFGLFEALSALPQSLPDYEVSIIGDGPARDKLVQSMEEAGLGRRVKLLGALPERETLQHIAHCDFLVLPSLMEGLPVVLIEARALGKPVIATAIAGIPELVSDRVDGLTFEPSNWKQLRIALETLLTDDDLRGKLSENAGSHFPEEFNIDKAASILAEKFRPILQSSHS